VFKSPRARQAKPLVEAVSARMRLLDLPLLLLWEGSSGAILPQVHGVAGVSSPLASGLSDETGQVDLLTPLCA
jgi:hypothetical protein